MDEINPNVVDAVLNFSRDFWVLDDMSMEVHIDNVTPWFVWRHPDDSGARAVYLYGAYHA